MNKLYDRIDFVNNTAPALNETNLNTMSKAVDDIDDRVIDIAGDVLVVVPEILDKYADIEALATNPPYIGNNGHWWTWDTDLNQYVDSGVDAGVSVTVGETITLPAGSDATVTNSGTATDPILNFGIPQGVAGQDGISPEVIIGEITGGHSVTITDADHPTGQTFNVMDGTNGQDGHGVPAGGTTGQVLSKASGTDYDTEWINASGGSGGHTIINDAGISMTQRAGLQFSGAETSDDSTNNKTIVKTLAKTVVSDEYADANAYDIGDYCIKDNVLYKIIQPKAAGASVPPPNASYYTPTNIVDELVAVFDDISNLKYMLYGAVIDGSYFNHQMYGGWIASGMWSIYLSGDSWYTKRINNGQTGDVPQTINYVDMTGYSRITLELGTVSDTNGAFSIQFIFEDGSTPVTVLNTGSPYQQNHTYTADISSINKKARISFSYYGYITAQIKKLYLT